MVRVHSATGEMVVLSPREAEVIALLAEGMPNKVIAWRLNITERTAKAHVSNLLCGLQLGNRVEVAAWFLRRPGAGRRQAVSVPPAKVGAHSLCA